MSLLLFDPTAQNAWVDQTGFPAEEIALQLYDAVDVFPARLRENSLIDRADEDRLDELREYVLGVQSSLFIGLDDYVDGWYVTDAAEWTRVRELSASALASLQRPTTQKHPT